MADTRIHGTTRRQVGKALRGGRAAGAAARCRWSGSPASTRRSRTVHRDGHVEVARRTTRCRRSTSRARSGSAGTPGWCGSSTIASSRSPCTRGTSPAGSAPSGRTSPRRRSAASNGNGLAAVPGRADRPADAGMGRGDGGATGSQGRASCSACRAWPKQAFQRIAGKRLRNRPFTTGPTACAPSASCSTAQAPRQEPLPFLSEHPLIRPLADYGRFVRRRGAHESRLPPQGFSRHGSGVPWMDKTPEPGCRTGERSQGPAASWTRPRSGYPFPGCASAEPESVSPDSIQRTSVTHRAPGEDHHE